MELNSSFNKFLKEIRLTANQKNDCKTGHRTLNDRLLSDESLKPIIVSTFLQGSYRRSTAVRPKNDKRADVDLIVVTKLSKEEYPNPDKAMDLFIPFLDKWYKDKYKKQGRSFGIELSYVDLDLVITSAPSEAEEEIFKSSSVLTDQSLEETNNWRLVKSWKPYEDTSTDLYKSMLVESRKEEEWKTEPLWIPDRDAGTWQETHPLEQIKWTYGKNAKCSYHYVNIVKAIKWWQRVNHPDDRPKSYPLEHLIGYCCPDFIATMAEGVTKTFDGIINSFKNEYESNSVPILPDHGVPSHNVLGRVNGDEFCEFYEHVTKASEIASDAYNSDSAKESSSKWIELFGSKFPPSDDDNGNGNKNVTGPFVPPSQKSSTGDLTPRKYG